MAGGASDSSLQRPAARWALALLAAASTATLYAEGVLKNGWIEVVQLLPAGLFLLRPSGTLRLENLLVALTAACLAASTLDLLLRPVMERRLSYTPLNVSAHKLPRLPILGRWDACLDLEDELYGDLAAIAGDPAVREPRRIRFVTDEAGFRNERIPPQIDLLVLGDSFGAGWGTTQDRIFARLLESKYGRRAYNLSYPGGPYNQYLDFVIESPRLGVSPATRLVWTFYAGNDLDDAGGETWDLAELPWRSAVGQWAVRYRTFRNRSPLNRLMEGVRLRLGDESKIVLRRRLPDGRPMLFHAAHEAWGLRAREEVERHPNFAKLERTLAAMRTTTDARGIEAVIVLLSTKGEVYRWVLEGRRPQPSDAAPSGFAQAVLKACERATFRCLDAKPFLVERARRLYEASGEVLWWRDDSHLGERGHEAVADFVAGALGIPAPGRES